MLKPERRPSVPAICRECRRNLAGPCSSSLAGFHGNRGSGRNRIDRNVGIFIFSIAGRSRPGATGEVVPGYEAVVLDEKSMQPVPDGESGLLAVKGPTGCRYLRLTDQQQKYVRQGWNIPGDIYVRDGQGFFHYQGRN